MTHTTKISADAARTMDRYAFLALYLVVATRRAENRGRLGYRIQHARGEYSVVSPIAGGTVVYRTSEADKLFDYARRGELGTLVREADQFRIDAHEAALAAAHREEMTAVGALPDHATPAQIDRCWRLADAANAARRALHEARDAAEGAECHAIAR